MKKNLLVLALSGALCTTTLFSFAGGVFDEGVSNINLGIGIGVSYYSSAYKQTMPPISLSYEYGVTDQLGVGLMVGHFGAKYELTYSTYDSNFNLVNATDTWKYGLTYFGARGAYHFTDEDNYDLYGGLMLGYATASSSYETTNPNASYTTSYSGLGSGVAWSVFVGGRYHFNDNIGAFAELGYGISWLNLGLNFTFGK